MSHGTTDNNPSTQSNSPLLQQVAAALVATGFTALIVLLAVLLITSVGQIQDILVQVDQSSKLSHRVGLVLAGCWFSMISWWSARFVFESMAAAHQANKASIDNKPPTKILPAAPGISTCITTWIPRLYAAVLPLVIAIKAANSELWEVFLINCLGIFVPVMVVVFYRRNIIKKLEARYFLSSRKDAYRYLISPYFWGGCALFIYAVVAVWALANPFGLGHFLGAFFVVYWGLGSILLQLVIAVCVVLPLVIKSIKKLIIRFWPESEQSLQKWSRLGLFAPPYPVFFVVAIVAVISAVLFDTDNHEVRRTEASAGYAYSSFDAAWEDFRSNIIEHGYSVKGSKGGVYPVFFVASQGGGLRAAYWASQGLAALEAEMEGIRNNIFSLAGVSGGSVGNGFFAAALAADESAFSSQCQHSMIKNDLACRLHKAVGKDYLSPVLTSFLYNDMLYRFLPISSWPRLKRDRAEVLETSWECGFYDEFGQNLMAEPLQSLYRKNKRENKSWLPLLMTMGAHQETGSRIISAPLAIDPEIFTSHYNVYSLMGCQGELDLSCDLRLSTAALNSARFPYVTPAGTLAKSKQWTKKNHIIDGGYAENFGLMATRSMIEYLQRQEDRLQFKTETKTVTLVPVIIVFSNDMDLTAGILDHKRDLPFPQANSFLLNELSNPIQGILASRTARSIQSYTQAIAMQQEYNHNQWFDKFRYTLEDEQQSERALDLKDFVVFKLDRDGINDTTEVPLGWWLSDTSQEYMAKKYLDSKYQPQQLIQQIKQRLDDPAVRR